MEEAEGVEESSESSEVKDLLIEVEIKAKDTSEAKLQKELEDVRRECVRQIRLE